LLFVFSILTSLLLPADLHPGLLHVERILFHDGALTQDAATTAEIGQRAEERLQVQVRFGEGQMILLTLGSVLDAREVDV